MSRYRRFSKLSGLSYRVGLRRAALILVAVLAANAVVPEVSLAQQTNGLPVDLSQSPPGFAGQLAPAGTFPTKPAMKTDVYLQTCSKAGVGVGVSTCVPFQAAPAEKASLNQECLGAPDLGGMSSCLLYKVDPSWKPKHEPGASVSVGGVAVGADGSVGVSADLLPVTGSLTVNPLANTETVCVGIQTPSKISDIGVAQSLELCVQSEAVPNTQKAKSHDIRSERPALPPVTKRPQGTATPTASTRF